MNDNKSAKAAPIKANPNEMLAEMLQRTASAMVELARSLSMNGGRPLDQRERELLRLAALSSVRAACEDIITGFINGDQVQVSIHTEEIQRLTELTRG